MKYDKQVTHHAHTFANAAAYGKRNFLTTLLKKNSTLLPCSSYLTGNQIL